MAKIMAKCKCSSTCNKMAICMYNVYGNVAITIILCNGNVYVTCMYVNMYVSVCMYICMYVMAINCMYV
jgi:hypothetical protein